MTIRLYPNKIMIGNFTLSEKGDGLAFDGAVGVNRLIETGGFQGDVAGYSSGGYLSGFVDTIDKFPFSADTNASDVANLTEFRRNSAGISSEIAGYNATGYVAPAFPPLVMSTVIDRFYFNSLVNAVNVGSLSVGKYGSVGHSSMTYGYISGGFTGAPPSPSTYYNTIEKFAFATLAGATTTSVGTLTTAKYSTAGQSGLVSGYISGGENSLGIAISTIEKFPFVTDASAASVGNMTQAKTYMGAGQSSDTSGFAVGGSTDGSSGNANIEKFPFATDKSSIDVGDLTVGRGWAAGQSSTTHGYTSGGYFTPGISGAIDKFPFAAELNATSVGSLFQSRLGPAGHQD